MTDQPTEPIEELPAERTRCQHSGCIADAESGSFFCQAHSRPSPTLPNPNVDIRSGNSATAYIARPYTVPSPVTYDYDILDWAFRVAFFVGGLGLGWLIFAHH